MKKEIKKIIAGIDNLTGTIAELQMLERRMSVLNDQELVALKECIAEDFDGFECVLIRDVIYLAEQLFGVVVLLDVKTPADFGYYLAHELKLLSIEHTYRKFFDYDGFGRYVLNRHPGRFTANCFIWKDVRPLPF